MISVGMFKFQVNTVKLTFYLLLEFNRDFHLRNYDICSIGVYDKGYLFACYRVVEQVVEARNPSAPSTSSSCSAHGVYCPSLATTWRQYHIIAPMPISMTFSPLLFNSTREGHHCRRKMHPALLLRATSSHSNKIPNHAESLGQTARLMKN
ncbi:hypothetical protein B0H12DRAFT_757875 [Mycena haematopus]|nr:hypothetical protein B0H12DRAFT_757875 [Mycena haematopus]